MGLFDIRVYIRPNYIYIEAMNYENVPDSEIDFRINNQNIGIKNINFRFGQYNPKKNDFDDHYYLEEETSMSFDKFILFMDELIQKYSKKIKDRL